jgi:ppGpp synthetase/RelA/SpoT-type nucleotidyltranferase
MDCETYRTSGRDAYAKLAKLAGELLAVAIKDAGAIKLQHVQHRAKELDSLEKKLARNGVLQSAEIEKAINDLAGCRLIFYADRDAERFLQSSILGNLFEID